LEARKAEAAAKAELQQCSPRNGKGNGKEHGDGPWATMAVFAVGDELAAM
jgi:hypothetical protein